MQKLFLILFLLVLLTPCNAQKWLKNEIGIGAGSIETVSKEHNTTLFFCTNLSAVTIANPFFFPGRSGYLITNTASTPTFHYGRKLSPHLFIQLNYQYSFAKGKYYDDMYGIPEIIDRTFKFNFHQSQFGLNFQLFEKKLVNPYFGVGFQSNMSKSIVQSNGISENYYSSDFMPFGCLGIAIPLHKHFSFQYNAALFADSEFLITKPINRLSVNYNF